MNKIRSRLGFLILALIVATYIGRLFWLQVMHHDFYIKKSKLQLNKIINIYPSRGKILDRNNTPLALTTPAYSIYIIPKEIENKEKFMNEVAPILGISWRTIAPKLQKDAPFVWLDRKVDPDIAKKLMDKNIAGLNFIKEEKRLYPHHTLAAHVLGFAGVDNQGLGGLEYKYDGLLKGEKGKILLEGDPRGRRLITGQRNVLQHLQNGGNIYTTLDEVLQYSVQKHLKAGVEKYNAKKGHVVVMNVKTGEILALANYPDFNPNEWQETNYNLKKNSVITDVFEPGSIFKPITLAAVLEENIVSPDTIIRVPPTLTLYGKVINEAHDPEPGESPNKTVTEIMTKSLNVGTTLLASKLGSDRFYKYIKRFGFGTRTYIELPGESQGLLRNVKDWNGLDVAMMSFGQALAVTPIQIITAINVIANKGMLINPKIIKYITNDNEETLRVPSLSRKDRIISDRTARMVIDMMTETVESGTGQIAKIPGYHIAGKTGTAQKAKENGLGYEKGQYIASFVGFFPAKDPEIIILVVVDSPKKHYYGSTVAGPIFKNIAQDTIQYLNIAPDNLLLSRP